MSFVNLVGNLATPSYDALYLVSSPILEEAAAAGGIFVSIFCDFSFIHIPTISCESHAHL